VRQVCRMRSTGRSVGRSWTSFLRHSTIPSTRSFWTRHPRLFPPLWWAVVACVGWERCS